MASKRGKNERAKDPTDAALEEAARRRGDALAAIERMPADTEEERDARDMARRYVKNGESLAALSRHFGVAPETIRARLMAAGIPLRPGTFRDPAFYRDKATALRMRALALSFVADCLDGFTIPPRDLLARTTGGE